MNRKLSWNLNYSFKEKFCVSCEKKTVMEVNEFETRVRKWVQCDYVCLKHPYFGSYSINEISKKSHRGNL